jgi:hypothetical protein
MPEGLTAVGEHARHTGSDGEHERRERWITISEAVLLSLVTLAAAWSGYSAAKWSTHSSVTLAKASADRAKSNRAFLTAMELRNLDSTFFNAWLNAYAAGNQTVIAISERRFRPEFRVAFEAWRRSKPETNRRAPPGPTYMPQYKQPAKARAVALDARATLRSTKARRRARPPTSTSGRRCSSRRFSFSSDSARTFRFKACDTGSWASAPCCSPSRR